MMEQIYIVAPSGSAIILKAVPANLFNKAFEVWIKLAYLTRLVFFASLVQWQNGGFVLRRWWFDSTMRLHMPEQLSSRAADSYPAGQQGGTTLRYHNWARHHDPPQSNQECMVDFGDCPQGSSLSSIGTGRCHSTVYRLGGHLKCRYRFEEPSLRRGQWLSELKPQILFMKNGLQKVLWPKLIQYSVELTTGDTGLAPSSRHEVQ